MTGPVSTTPSAWDQNTQANFDEVDNLSRIVSGNKNLVTEPGLVQALWQQNATPQEAQAIDQFVGGLRAEAKVRTAAAAGTQIALSQDEQSALDAMGINYSQVIKNPTTPLTDLKTRMAAQGKQPVLDQNGNVETDANGNPKSESFVGQTAEASGDLQQHKSGWSFGRVFHDVTHNPATNLLGNFVQSGALSTDNPATVSRLGIGSGGIGTDLHVANEGYNFVSSTLSQEREQNIHPYDAVAADTDQAALMKQLGYDPSSFFSVQAFKARGYAFNNNDSAKASWAKLDPSQQMGLDPDDAVIQAETFIDNPRGYTEKILSDTTLTDQQKAARLALLNTPQFSTLVKRVTANKADLGTDFARSIGIDPVKHSTAFKVTSAAANVAASFVADPLAVGLSAYTAAQRSSVAIGNFSDAESINRILTEGTSVAATRVQDHVKDLVALANDARDASAAGDVTRLAQIQARANANPYGGLLSDFTGESRILNDSEDATKPAIKTEAAIEDARAAGEKVDTTTFVVGRGDPIDTYEKAVEYLSSKAGLFRLMGGKAPVEFSTMPGALSSYGVSRLRGSIASWSTARNITSIERAAANLVDRAGANVALRQKLITDKMLAPMMPQVDDAVDYLSGRVIAAKQAGDAEGLASAQRALDARTAELADSSPLQVTAAGRGMLRANQLRYGKYVAPNTKLGKLLSIYTLGTLQRAKVVIARMANQLPRDLRISVDSGSGAQSVRQIARTYLTPGDADMLAARWANGTADTRRVVIDALYDQVYHAAGLSRTKAGRDLMDARDSAPMEAYSSNGVEYVDANGRNAAQWPAQVQTNFTLPSFGKIQKAAARIGLYEATMGRFLNSDTVEQLMSIWRTSVLATAVTANRAIIEPWLNAIMGRDGIASAGAAAKAVLRDRDAALRAQLVNEEGLKGTALRNAMRERGILTHAGIGRSWVAESIANTIGFRDLGKIYRNLAKRSLTDDELNALKTMPEDIVIDRLLRQARSHWAQEVDPSGTREASQIAEAGLVPKQLRYNTERAWDPGLRKAGGFELTDEVDGQEGANAYAFTLGSRVNTAPHVAKAVLDRIEHADQFDAQHVIDALESGDAKRLMDQTLYGKVFTDEAGIQRQAITPDEVAEGKKQWADQITADLQQLLTGRNAKYQQKIADYIREHGQGPSSEWLQENVKQLNRPYQMIRPVWVATVPEDSALSGVEKLRALRDSWATAIQETTGKAYSWLVERNIQRNSSGPLFAGAYAKSKVGLDAYKQALLDGGLTDEVAERSAAEAASQQAWERVALMNDDPSIKMQMDIAGRSFFAFSRATTAMLRRWGRTFWQNPDMARRAQLAAEGAIHSGLVYQDPTTGGWMIAVPMSGVAQEVVFHAMSHIPGLEGVAAFPFADFQGKVSSIIPGSANPFQYQTTPIVSIVGRKVASLFPDGRLIFDDIDAKMNGSSGQGRSTFDTLAPRLVGQYVDSDGPGSAGMFGNDSRNSILTSSMIGALYNLYAAGHVPKDGASAVEEQQFLDRLKTGTRSTMFARFLLGSLSPATLSQPDAGGGKPDFAFAQQGVKYLADEFKEIINQTGNYADALAVWTALHPDKTIYEATESTSLAKGAALPATKAAYQWMAKNDSLIKKYGTLAAYFLPPATGDEKYSVAAYRAQIEEGFRQKKTPQEFLDGVRISNASDEYYAAKDDYEAKLAKAKADYDQTEVTGLNSQWAAWSHQFKAEHPTFAHYLSGVTANTAAGQDQLDNLKTMVAQNEVPGPKLVKQAVSNMLSAYDGYQQFINSHQGTTTFMRQQRSQALVQLQEFMSATIAAAPQIKGLYNGVFRPALDNVLDYAN